MKNITIKYLNIGIITLLLSNIGVHAQKSMYDYFQPELDRGDTVKIILSSKDSITYPLELGHLIKKNDTTLIIHRITIPYIESSGNWPPPHYFDNLPYSIEVPNGILNVTNYNIRNATGRLSVYSVHDTFNNKPILYENYLDFDFYDFLEYALNVDGKTDSIFLEVNHDVLEFFNNKDWLSESFLNEFGTKNSLNPHYFWGFYYEKDFIIVLENVENGIFLDDGTDPDYIDVYLDMAKSVQSIDPDIFDLNEIHNYKFLADYMN